MSPLRWGIIGAGKISHDFVTAVQIFPENHTVVAVGSQNKENAETFAKKHNITKAHASYEEIAKSNEVDIVYIGNLNTQHHSATKLMLEHGKHVLCEKPFTMNEKQTTELINLAKSKKLFLMEAVWSRFFPVYLKARELIDNGEIGDVIYASASFGFDLTHKERATNKQLGGSAILDVGVYCLQFQQFAFRGHKIKKIVSNGYLTEQGVDGTAGALITYEGGKLASISCSAEVQLPNEGVIIGTKGTLKFPNFWCPTQLIANGKTYDFELSQTKGEFFHFNSAGLSYEANAIKKYIEEGVLESNQMPLDETKELARLMDTWRKEIGLYFPEDQV